LARPGFFPANRGRVFTDLAVVLADGGQGMTTSYRMGGSSWNAGGRSRAAACR